MITKPNIEEEDGDSKYYLQEKLRIKKKKKLAQQKLGVERRINSKARSKKFFFCILKFPYTSVVWTIKLATNFTRKVLEPQVLISVVAAALIYIENLKTSKQLDQQQAFQQQLQLQQLEKISNPKSLIKKIIESGEFKGYIVKIGGTAALVFARHVAVSNHNHEKVRIELTEAKTKLHQSSTELTGVHAKLKATEKLSDEKDILYDNQVKAVKEKNAIYQNQIKKLHVTLNRFNSMALNSIRKEVLLNTEINRMRQKLGDAIEQQELTDELVLTQKKELESQKKSLGEFILDKRILDAKITNKEEQIIELEVSLSNLKNKWNLEYIGLSNKLTKTNKNLKETQKLLLSKDASIEMLTTSNKKLDIELEKQNFKTKSSLTEISKLKLNAKINKKKLREVEEESNAYALKMDVATRQLTDQENTLNKNQETLNQLTSKYRNSLQKNHETTKDFNASQQELTRAKKKLSAYKKKFTSSEYALKELNNTLAEKLTNIIDLDNNQELLKNQLENLNRQIKENTTEKSYLNDKIVEIKEVMETASYNTRIGLEATITRKSNKLARLEKENKKLKEADQILGRELALNFVKQEDQNLEAQDLKKKMDRLQINNSKLRNELKLSQTSNFFNLQEKRNEFHNLQNTSTELTNDLLNQQDRDQKRLNKTKFFNLSFLPTVNFGSQKLKGDAEKEVVYLRESHFYGSQFTGDNSGHQAIPEKFNAGTKKWDIGGIE